MTHDALLHVMPEILTRPAELLVRMVGEFCARPDAGT
jgi:hypothetical protein